VRLDDVTDFFISAPRREPMMGQSASLFGLGACASWVSVLGLLFRGWVWGWGLGCVGALG